MVLGSNWEGTETVIRGLAIGGMALALQRVNYSVLSARGYSRLIMWVGAGALGSTIVAILVAYPFGLNATVIALTVQTLLLQAVIMYVTAGALNARFRDLARPLGRIAAATVVMAAGVVVAVDALRRLGVGDAGILVTGIVVGALVFLPLLLRLEPELIAELKGFARHGRGPTAPTRPRPHRGAPSPRNGPDPDEPTDADHSPRISFGLPVRNGASTIGKAIESVLARRSRTGSSSSPTTSRPTGRRTSAPRSRRATSVSTMSRPDAISRSTRTSVQRSTTRVARTFAGDREAQATRNDLGLDSGEDAQEGASSDSRRSGPKVLSAQGPNLAFRSHEATTPTKPLPPQSSFAQSVLWGFTVAARISRQRSAGRPD